MADFKSDEDFESLVHCALKATGLVLPENEEDIEILEKEFEEVKNSFPQKSKDPLSLLNNNKLKTKKLIRKSNAIHNEELAYAARNGEEISDSVRTKMNEDRKKQEEE
jgi:hypothetical protein